LWGGKDFDRTSQEDSLQETSQKKFDKKEGGVKNKSEKKPLAVFARRRFGRTEKYEDP